MSLKDKIKGKRNTAYVFFSGKGGVGKTSCAAAYALHQSLSGKKTLVISIDPAHSLSDSFGIKIGGEIKELKKNLFAVEIDPAKSLEEYKTKFSVYAEGSDLLKGLGMEDTFDFAGMTPGIDEIAAFDKFLQYMQSSEYDVIIFDTAPTGHALRFLSLPDVLDSWIGKLISLKMKFASVAGLVKKFLPFSGETKGEGFGGKQLEEMKERIQLAKTILSDPKKTSFNLVLIPEAMSILESERALKTLAEYNIPVKTVIVNQIVPQSKGCGFCSNRRANQLKRLEEIKKKFSGQSIKTLEQFEEEVVGFRMLEKVGKIYR